MYDQRLALTPYDGEAIAGKLKCLDNLGRWEEAISLCNDSLDHLRVEAPTNNNGTGQSLQQMYGASSPGRATTIKVGSPSMTTTVTNNVPTPPGVGHGSINVPGPGKDHSSEVKDLQLFTKAAVLGARSAWSLNNWGIMSQFVSQLPTNNTDACFLRAVIAAHDEDYTTSADFIEQTRRHLDSSIAALLAESYSRGYDPLIMVQQCAELEEIIEFKIQVKESGSTGETGLSRSSSSSSIVVDSESQSNDLTSSSSTNAETLNSRSIPISGRKKKRPVRLCDMMNTTNTTTTTSLNVATSTASPLTQSYASSPSLSSMTPLVKSLSFPKLPNRAIPTNIDDCDSEQLVQWTATQHVKRMKSLLVEKWRRRIKGCPSTGRAAISVWKVRLFVYSFHCLFIY